MELRRTTFEIRSLRLDIFIEILLGTSVNKRKKREGRCILLRPLDKVIYVSRRWVATPWYIGSVGSEESVGIAVSGFLARRALF